MHHLCDLLALRRSEHRVGFVVGEGATRCDETGDAATRHRDALALSIVLGLGSNHVDTCHHVWLGKLIRRLKLVAIGRDRIEEMGRREVRGECVWQAKCGSKAGAEQ